MRCFKPGHADEAIAHFRKALEINPDNIITLKNLAIALVRNGQPGDAIPLVKKALALAKSAGDEPLVKEISVNLEKLYELNRSFQKSPR